MVVNVSQNDEEDSVDTLSPAQDRMSSHWSLVQSLWGQTPAMRAAGETWLPKFEAEKDTDYSARLNGTFLLDGFRDAVDSIVAKPFSKPATYEGTLPTPLDPFWKDVDGSGRSLHSFAKQVFRGGWKWGMSLIFVDATSAPLVKNRALSKAEEEAAGIRPILTRVDAPDVISVRVMRVRGQWLVSEFRFFFTDTAPGEFRDTQVRKIKRFVSGVNTGVWEVYVKADDEREYIKETEGTHSFTLENGGLTVLPFIPGEQLGRFEATPPLESLAWKNLEHWQSSSDQRNILKVARVPILLERGITADSGPGARKVAQRVIGSTRRVRSTNHQADMKYIEISGTGSIAAGERDLAMIEEQMERLRARPWVQRSGEIKATATALAADSADNDVKASVNELGTTLTRALISVGATIGVNESQFAGFAVKIHEEFTIPLRDNAGLRGIDAARARRDIDRQTWVEEYQRRGELSDGVDIDVIEERLALEAEVAAREFTLIEDDAPDTEDPIIVDDGSGS